MRFIFKHLMLLLSLFLQMNRQNNNLTRLSFSNEITDLAESLIRLDVRRLIFFQTLREIREQERSLYNKFDYGSGYYYQSSTRLKIRGFRNTQQRISALDLETLLAAQDVLDIGSNAGFLLIDLADHIRRGFGVEINPFLVKQAREAAKFSQSKNLVFVSGSFEDLLVRDNRFTRILSFANHKTIDGQSQLSVELYFKKIYRILAPGGLLIFESHPLEIESDQAFQDVLELARCEFRSLECLPAPKFQGFLDTGRRYFIARK